MQQRTTNKDGELLQESIISGILDTEIETAGSS